MEPMPAHKELNRKYLLLGVAKLLVCVVVLKTLLSILSNYYHYTPADFSFGFLVGRESYFWNGYHWAFYSHIVAGPICLALCLLLMSNSFRRRYLNWHRRLGKIQIVCVVLFVAPSGLWMALYADGGRGAVLGFASLALATAACPAMGWRAILQKDVKQHRIWMSRCFLLINSAVVLRLSAGLLSILELDAPETYVINAWLCWLGPITIHELALVFRKHAAT